MIKFKPKLFTLLRTYSVSQLVSDLRAGVIVGIVAMPIALAYAIASGVIPEAGLITAIIAGFLISLLGGSRTRDNNPPAGNCFTQAWFADTWLFCCDHSYYPAGLPV